MDVELLRPGTVPISRDTLLWFDFLLDPSRGDLLEKHLNKTNPDPSGTDLIIKFLTIPEQSKEPVDAAVPPPTVDGSNGSTTTDPSKIPSDKSNPTKLNSKNVSLKILALKIAAFYKWDLELLEQKLPLPLQMTLLSDLLMLANVSNKNAGGHLSIDYTSEPDHVLFAVSLYHRWALRTVTNASQANKQGRFNNLHGIQDPQYIALCVTEELMSRLEEEAERSVEVISKIVEAGNTRGIHQDVPSSKTFMPLSEDDIELNINWESSSNVISVNEFHCQLLFDVSVYQFFRESYTTASQNFDMCYSRFQDWCRENTTRTKDTDDMGAYYCHVQHKILDGYIAASRPLMLQTPGVTLTQRFLVSCRDNYTKLLEILQEDNIKREIPQAYRDCLELELAAGLSSGTLTATRDLLIQIQTLNVIRRVLDSNVTNYNFALKLGQARKAEEILTWALQRTVEFDKKDINKLRSFMNDLILACDKKLAKDICNIGKLKHLISDELLDYVRNSASSSSKTTSSMMDTSDGFDTQLTVLREIHNPQLEMYTIERQLLKTNNPVKIKELVCNIATNSVPSMRNAGSLISRLDPKWEVPQPLQSALSTLSSTVHQQFLYIMLAKAKELEKDKDWKEARHLLSVVAEELKMGSVPTNIMYRLRQLVDWEIILLDINQFHTLWPARMLDRRELGMRCLMLVQSATSDDKHTVMLPRPELLEAAFVTLLNLSDWESVTSGPFLDKISPACQLVSAIGFACQDIIKFKGNKKVSRDAWDLVLPTFMNQGGSGNKRIPGGGISIVGASGNNSQSNNLTLQIVTKVFLNLRDLTALTVAISLLARIHNVLKDDQYSLELITDHTALWPGVVSNTNCYNMRAVTELLLQMLTQAITFYPTSVSWLKLFGDLYFVMQHYAASLKYYVMAAIQNTDYFIKPLAMEDHVYKRMMKCCSQLQCFAQAGVLCQFTEEVDYNTAFKSFSEQQVSWDAMDSYYDCIWDVNILEYLIQLHHKRGEVYRKQKSIKMIGLLELNANNNEEIKREAANIRKSRFMRALTNQYVGLCALSNARQFSISSLSSPGKMRTS